MLKNFSFKILSKAFILQFSKVPYLCRATLNSFDDQERNLTFVKTNFQVLKLKFHACSFKFPSFKTQISCLQF